MPRSLRQRDRAVAVGGHREIGGLVAGLEGSSGDLSFSLVACRIFAGLRHAPRRQSCGPDDQPVVPGTHARAGGSHICVEPGEVNRAGAARQGRAGRAGQRRRVRQRPRTTAPSSAAQMAQQGERLAQLAHRPAAAVRRPRRARRAPRRSRAAAPRGARAASRSIRYCTMNSRSTSPPRRLRRSHGEGRGCLLGDAAAHVGDIGEEPPPVARRGQRRRDRRRDPLAQRAGRRRSAAPGSAPCAPRSRPIRADSWAKAARLDAIGPDSPDGRSRMSTS